MTDDQHDLAAAYALGALSELERARFERELATSPELRAEVDSYAGVLAALGSATPAAPPPERVRSNVLAAIATTPQDSAAPSGAARSSRRDSDSAARSRAARTRRRTAGGAALLAAAAVAAGVVVVHPWSHDDQQTPVVNAAAQVSAASDAHTYSATVQGHLVTVTRSASLGQAAVQGDALPALPAGHTYQLWLMQGGTPVNAGLYDPTSGSQVLTGDARSASAAAVSVEPAGGSPSPTTTPVAVLAFG